MTSQHPHPADPNDEGLPGKWLILIMAQIGVFMCTFDSGVVNLALPVISTEFNSSLAAIKWVVIAYSATAALTLPTAAYFGRRFGVCRTYMFGQILFTVSSVCCGLAGNLEVLVILRFISAIGAAIILALNQVIMLAAFPRRLHGRALGISGSTFALGILFGLGAGGILIHLWSWRSIFLINLPFGLIMVGIGMKVLRAADLGLDDKEKIAFDWKGMLWGAVALGLLVFTVSHLLGRQSPLWLNIALLACSAIAVYGWLHHELNASESFLNLHLLKTPPLANNFTNAFTVRVVIGSVNFIIPFYLQYTLNLSPFHAGLALSTGAVAMGIFGPFAGAWTDRYGMRQISRIGLTAMAVALCGYAFLPPSVSSQSLFMVLAAVIIGQFICGTGSVFFSAANTYSCLHSVPPKRWGAISSLQSVTLMAGTALGSTISADLVSAWTVKTTKASQPITDALGTNFPPFALALLFGVGGLCLIILAVNGWMKKNISTATA